MADVKTVDIDGSQWNMKDQEARNRIAALEEKQTKIIDIIFGGTTSFLGKMKYLGEDDNYEYYNFWWEPQNKVISITDGAFLVTPQNINTDKIINLNMNMLQAGNSAISQNTQHMAGQNDSGIITYITGLSASTSWLVSGMGILRRNK